MQKIKIKMKNISIAIFSFFLEKKSPISSKNQILNFFWSHLVSAF